MSLRARVAVLAVVVIAACAPTMPATLPLGGSPAALPAGDRDAALWSAVRATQLRALGGGAELTAPGVLVRFRPRHELEIPGDALLSVAPLADEDDPIIGTVEPPQGAPITLRATNFVGRAFQHFDSFATAMLTGLVRRAVARLEAKVEGIGFTDREIATATDRVMLVLQARARRQKKRFEDLLAEQGYPSVAVARQSLLQHVPEVLVQEQLYWLQYQRFPKVELALIALPGEAGLGRESSKTLAASIVRKIRAGKMTFDDAVGRYSIDRKSKAVGGRLGKPVTPAARMFKVERDAVFKLRQGEITDPIRTELGYRIYKALKVTPPRPNVSWADVRGEIHQMLEGDDPERPLRLVPGNLDLRQVNQWLDYVLSHKPYRVERFYPRPTPDSAIVARILDVADPKKPRTLARVSAGAFVTYAFSKNPIRARIITVRTVVPDIARLEAKREGITLKEGTLSLGVSTTLKWLETKAGSAKALKATWQRQGFASRAAFRDLVRRQVRELVLLEKLVLLHDLRVERRRLSHILLLTEPESKRAQKQLAGGADFAALARLMSHDAKTSKSGGDLGIVPRGTYPEAFEKAAFSLAVGAISAPVSGGRQGYHIIRCDEIFPARPNGTYAELADAVFLEQSRRGAKLKDAKGRVIGTVPGTRVSAADVFRWLDSVQKGRGYKITLVYPGKLGAGEPGANKPGAAEGAAGE